MKRYSILILTLLFSLVQFLPGIDEDEKKKEFSIHYSTWGWNIIRRPLENVVGNLLESRLQEVLFDEIKGDFPGARLRDYRQSIDFDSGGSNFGFEARWYPAGKGTTFSVGFSLEQSTWRIALSKVKADMEVVSDSKPGQTGLVHASAENVELRIQPLSFHLQFCWDYFPYWPVHPYLSFGFGLFSIRGFEEGRFTMSYRADLTIPDIQSFHYEGEFNESAREFIDKNSNEGSEIKLPSLLPIVELRIGVCGEFGKHLTLRIDAGFFNGFSLRGGIGIRL